MPQKEISKMVILFCLYNARGRVLAGAKISDNVMPGVVVLSTGAWFDPDYDLNIERHGNPNVLTKDVGTSSLGQGPTCHTTLVELKKTSNKLFWKHINYKILKNTLVKILFNYNLMQWKIL